MKEWASCKFTKELGRLYIEDVRRGTASREVAAKVDFRVYKSDDGHMIVQSKYDDFIASFKHGEWVNDMVFDPLELRQIPLVEDDHEALIIVKEAKKALNRF